MIRAGIIGGSGYTGGELIRLLLHHPEAELAEFSCVMKEWSGSDTLHFNVAVKNVSDTPQRFRVNIFLDNGKAVGGLIPRKTKDGLVQPGDTAKFVYPVKDMDRGPKSVTVMVKTMSQ